jgi:hypothetical protein
LQYAHQTQLSEIPALPSTGDAPVYFWTANVRHVITVQDGGGWSLFEESGSLVGEFRSEDGGFAVIDDDSGEVDRFDNWRSAVRRLLRRGLRAA